MKSGDTTLKQTPFDVLVRIERKWRVLTPALPQEEGDRRRWTGVHFRIRGFDLVIPIAQLHEIIDMPTAFPIPGVKHWVLGLANRRGNLLPIVDLGKFIFADDVSAQGRLLIIEIEGSMVGLRVDAVYGMRHFWEDHKIPKIPELPDQLRKFIKRAYLEGDRVWAVFDIEALKASQDFMDAAA